MADKPIKRRSSGPFVVSASNLRHGHVVWLGAGDVWRRSFAEAALFPGIDAETVLACLQGDSLELEVVDLHLVDVTESPDGPTPITYRERIRAGGPSIAFGAAEADIGSGDL